jgi:hypothetical protein
VNKTLALLCALALAGALAGGAPDSAAESAKQQPVVGTWQGSLPNGMGGQIRVVLKVRQTAEGALTATMDSPDQNASDIPVAKITVEIAGTWKQSGQALPLLFKREAAKDAVGK